MSKIAVFVNHQISFSTDFCYPDNKSQQPICKVISLFDIVCLHHLAGITSGFDCKLMLWDIEESKVLRECNVKEICEKYFPGQLVCPPNIYSVYGKKTQLLVSTETGHILCLSHKELKKPKYIIDAHLGKVMRSIFAKFNENYIVSCSTDKSFAIWDSAKKNEIGVPILIERITIPEKPNWIETSKDFQIFVPDVTPLFHIYTVKAG